MNNSLPIVERITARMKTIYLAIQEVIDEMVSTSQTRMETDELVAKVASSLGMKASRIKQIVIDYLWQTETDKIGFVRKGAGGGYVLGIRPAKTNPKTKKTVVEELTTDEDEGVADLTSSEDEELEEIAI